MIFCCISRKRFTRGVLVRDVWGWDAADEDGSEDPAAPVWAAALMRIVGCADVRLLCMLLLRQG